MELGVPVRINLRVLDQLARLELPLEARGAALGGIRRALAQYAGSILSRRRDRDVCSDLSSGENTGTVQAITGYPMDLTGQNYT